jgi:5-methyltetrahydropteroyltriglutamate--homocysteine methyltransferase
VDQHGLHEHAPPIGGTVLGYPRIGPDRELKRATEAYWAGRIDEDALQQVARDLRKATFSELAARGLESVPAGTFSFYDYVLDTAVLFDTVPARFGDLGLSPLDTYFAMARGTKDVAPLELTKWFDTNYHYLVPEIGPDTTFRVSGNRPEIDVLEAHELGVVTRPVLLGPVTFLLLAKPAPGAPVGFRPLDRLDDLTDRYLDVLGTLARLGVPWVQLDEPALVADRTPQELAAVQRAYQRLASQTQRPALLVASYFGDPGPALPVLAEAGVEGVALDLVSAPEVADRVPTLPRLRSMTVVAGVVDGRNVWRTDLPAAAARCVTLLGSVRELAVSSSCSLLHVPYDLDRETALDNDIRARLAFARQKVDEVALLARILRGEVTLPPIQRLSASRVNDRVRARLQALRAEHRRRAPYSERSRAQQLRFRLPPLATTTIGSFPQTAELRTARAELRSGAIDQPAYNRRIEDEVKRVIGLQERIGLDVLVHGEPERNDMVQYFAEQLDGFAATEHGWVQSYGTRCVRPPILHSDISRPHPMTVRWATYAQSLTHRPVKGMLTGPVTMLAWSFVRDDQPLADTADQVALALRDEVRDLEAAGIGIIQIDEPALRELLPLRAKERKAYLDWAVGAFRLATGAAATTTQVHTHLCYSEFGDVIEAIDQLDADVTTIEAARSRMEVLDDLDAIGFQRGVGPGVYDIHSPRVPSTAELRTLVATALRAVPADRLWVNPDCGLKTRTYAEVEPALMHLVEAARAERAGDR